MVNQRPRKPGLKAPPRVEHIAHRRASDEPTTDEAMTDEAVIDEPAADEPAADEPVTDEPVTDEPVTDEPMTDEPVTDEPGIDDAVTDARRRDDAWSEATVTAPDDELSSTTDDPSGPPTDSESLDASAETDDPASPDLGDPLAAMLAEFDAPRPVAPGVQLTEEIPIDPEDDLRAVEGEASLRLVSILESLLFAAARPLRVQDLRKVLAETSKHQIQLALKHLMAVTRERGVVLAQVAGGFQFRTHPDNAVWVQKMLQAKPARLSRTQIETLAIVAYRQPITRPEIDDVRGVDSGAVLKTLLERELIQIVGRKEEPGRPLLYGTTVRFLEFFNLRSLRDLPTLRDFRDLSEESKATVRAKFGESEAEALGQGVLGLDGEDGEDGEGEAPLSPTSERLDEAADPPAPDASSRADVDANEETTDAAPQVSEHLEATIEPDPLDASSEPDDATDASTPSEPQDATISPDDASTPSEPDEATIEPDPFDAANEPDDATDASTPSEPEDVTVSPDDTSTPSEPDDASTPREPEDATVVPDDASTPDSPEDATVVPDDMSTPCDANTPDSPEDATVVPDDASTPVSRDEHVDLRPTDLEADPAPSATSESAPIPELTTAPAVPEEPGSEGPPDAVEASQPEPAHADDERLIDDVER